MGICTVESRSAACSNRLRRVSGGAPVNAVSDDNLSVTRSGALSAAPPAPAKLAGAGTFGGSPTGAFWAAATPGAAAWDGLVLELPALAPAGRDTTGRTSVTDSTATRCGGAGSEPLPLRATASDPALTAERRIIQSMSSTAAAATLTATDTHAQSTAPVSKATTSRPNAIRTRIRTSSSTISLRVRRCGASGQAAPPA